MNGQLHSAVFYVWELLLNFSESQFPVFVAGQFLKRDELIEEVAQIILADPNRIRDRAGEEQFKQLRELCEEEGFNTAGSDE